MFRVRQLECAAAAAVGRETMFLAGSAKYAFDWLSRCGIFSSVWQNHPFGHLIHVKTYECLARPTQAFVCVFMRRRVARNAIGNRQAALA